MKLSDYVSQVCDALEANPTSATGQIGNVNITLNSEHMFYRNAIANVLRNALCGTGSYASDMLFSKSQQIDNAYHDVLQKQQELEKNHEEAIQGYIKSGKESALSEFSTKKRRGPKPNREIQVAPRRGRIPKKKIEEAMNAIKDKKDGNDNTL